MAPPDSGAHVWLSRAAAWAVRGGGVHGSGSSHDAAPLSARMAPAARRTGAMAPVAKGDPRGRPRVDPACRNLTQSPPLEFGPEAARRQTLRKHYASAKLKLTNTHTRMYCMYYIYIYIHTHTGVHIYIYVLLYVIHIWKRSRCYRRIAILVCYMRRPPPAYYYHQ